MMMDQEPLSQYNQPDNNVKPPFLTNIKIPNSNLNPHVSNHHHHHHRLMNGFKSPQSSICFEIRLFYVRFSPCVIDTLPDHLTLRHIRRELGVFLEINGSRIPASDIASSTLRRDRVDRESSEVIYVSTDSIKITGGVEFEVYEDENNMILCGSLERFLESNWGCNGFAAATADDDNSNHDSRNKSGWNMDCYTTSSISNPGNGGKCAGGASSSVFCQPKLGVSSPSIEVYIAGCCSGVPVILNKTITVSPRRKFPRCATLDAIPENEEIGKEQKVANEYLCQRKFQLTESEVEDCFEPDGKYGHSWHSEEMYAGEDGQLSWFNAGVRVGVGIGLGMCVGVGIGVGLLMRSYQVTTRNLRRRFL